MQQSTLFDEDTQELAEAKPSEDETAHINNVSPILHRLFKQWDRYRSLRARMEAAMSGPYDDDLSLCLDACVSDEEETSDEITARLAACEQQSW